MTRCGQGGGNGPSVIGRIHVGVFVTVDSDEGNCLCGGAGGCGRGGNLHGESGRCRSGSHRKSACEICGWNAVDFGNRCRVGRRRTDVYHVVLSQAVCGGGGPCDVARGVYGG